MLRSDSFSEELKERTNLTAIFSFALDAEPPSDLALRAIASYHKLRLDVVRLFGISLLDGCCDVIVCLTCCLAFLVLEIRRRITDLFAGNKGDAFPDFDIRVILQIVCDKFLKLWLWDVVYHLERYPSVSVLEHQTQGQSFGKRYPKQDKMRQRRRSSKTEQARRT